ncbi:MAG: hypothetical protein GKR90_15545 [Pseudomonadales bacterium]|nr:hypothetical protein [Pseudomonadales bacterium]
MKLLKRSVFAALLLATAGVRADFAPEPIGTVEVLPSVYPEHWMLVHDFSFFHMSEGEIQVVDPLADTLGGQYKGMFPASFIATYKYSAQRNEHYVAESFFSRGARGGERTDVLTIWDPATLQVKGEVVIPAKRITGMPKRLMSGLLDNDKFIGVYNFTPAQSISIVNLEDRSFVAEIPTPGCGFMLPVGQRSFSSICSNGSLLTSHLNEDGTLQSTSKSGVVFDPENDPIFENPGVAKDTAYFATFQGKILPIGTSNDEPEVGEAWWLSAESERNWRPGGMSPLMADSSGVGYVLMNPEGGEGTHKDGGSEVWVIDLTEQKRTARIELKNWGISLGSTGTGDGRLMVVTNADLALDVYSIPSGEYVKTLNTGAQTPFTVYGNN